MVTVTLDDRDGAVLERLRRGDADVESLAESADCPPDPLRDRLPELADNGLVRRVDEDVYALTDDGRRALVGTPAGTMDGRVDTPDDVERELRSFDLRPDREEAVRNAFAFLRYWGDATGAEVIDGVYSENPAGFESREAWWTECVRDRLAALPGVEASDSPDRPWRSDGTATDEAATEDGRTAPDETAERSSVRQALERASLDDDERAAVRAAFAFLVGEGEATAAEIRNRAYPDHEAGYDSAVDWWTDCVGDELGTLPGVERPDDDGDVWRYRRADEGEASTGPGAETPDEPLGPLDDDG